jgi:tetratricopeptide (TPR) repeat protein
MITFYLTWIALVLGAAAATAALYGHYRVLPAWLTGPEVCLMEDGGCAVLFRSPRSRLLGVPNALLGVTLYILLAAGLLLQLPAWLLFAMTVPALAMSIVLGHSLITRKLECRICWTGHFANALLALTLLLRALPVPSVAAQTPDPDALYKQREQLASAQQAEGIWAERLAKDPKDFESAWKLARARYWLGTHADEKRRKPYLESGIDAGRAAIAAAPAKPDGHFWVAANMGALAESFGMRQGLKYRGDIKDELETVLRLDPAFQQGSADRALGRWYSKVPGLFGGSDKKSEEHLRKSLTYNPNSSSSLYFLAETLIELGKKDEARATLEKLLAAPVDPDWVPEDREFKKMGARLGCKVSMSNAKC